MATDPDGGEITDASIMVVGPRKRGRPPAEEPSTSLSMWVPNRYYDRIASIAQRNGVSMSAVVRQMIILQLHQK